MMDRTAEGVEQIRVAARLDPLSLVILIEVGELLQAAGRDAEATAAYEHVRRLYPGTYLTNYFVGIHFLQRGDFARAADLLGGFATNWSEASALGRRVRAEIRDGQAAATIYYIIAYITGRCIVRSINALALRKRLGQILDDVADGGQPLLVTRGNRPLVVLVPASQYEQVAGARHQRLTTASRRVAEWRAEYVVHRPDLDPVDLVRRDRDRP